MRKKRIIYWGGTSGGSSAPPEQASGEYAEYKKKRNPKRLTIDNLVSEDDDLIGGKVVMLFDVPKNGLYIRVRLGGLPDVDWGDGHNRVGGSGSSYYEHTIKYEDISASTQLKCGDRQAIVEVTAHGGAPIKYIYPYNKGYKYGASPVEMIIMSSKLEAMDLKHYRLLELLIVLGTNKVTQLKTMPEMLKYVEYDFGSQTRADKFGMNMINDPKMKLDITNMTKMDYFNYASCGNFNLELTGTPAQEWTAVYMFGNMKAGEIKPIDYSKCKSFYLFAYNSPNIICAPPMDMATSTKNSRCFKQAYGLKSVSITNCKSSLSFYMCRKLPLGEIIDLGLNSLVDMTGGTEQSVDIRQSMAVDDFKSLGDDGKILHRGVEYGQSDIVGIFTNINWSLVT